MQRHHVSRPHTGLVKRKERVLEPTATVHDIRTLSLDHTAQGGYRARVRSGRVEGVRNVRVKAREMLAPTAYADDPHAVNSLLIWEIAGLKGDDNDAVAELDEFCRQGGDMPFKTTNYRMVEISELHDMHLPSPSDSPPPGLIVSHGLAGRDRSFTDCDVICSGTRLHRVISS